MIDHVVSRSKIRLLPHVTLRDMGEYGRALIIPCTSVSTQSETIPMFLSW